MRRLSLSLLLALVTAGIAGPAAARDVNASKGCATQRCHAALNSGAKFKFVHGPVATGSCAFCHTAHTKQSKSALTAAGAKLCFRCHSADQFKARYRHAALDKGCTACHAPHGGQRQHLLRKAPAQLCASCHGNKSSTASSPRHATKSACLKCHAPHGADHRKLLRRGPAKASRACTRSGAARKATARR